MTEEEPQERYEYPVDTVYRYTGTARLNKTSAYITIPRFWGFVAGDEVMMELTNLRTGEKVRAAAGVLDVGTSYRVTIPSVCKDIIDIHGLTTVALMSREGYAERLERCATPADRAQIFRTEAV